MPLDERTAARNYVATLLLAAAPERYASFVRSQIVQVRRRGGKEGRKEGRKWGRLWG